MRPSAVALCSGGGLVALRGEEKKEENVRLPAA